MRKYLVEEVVTKQETLDSITCNMCGKEVELIDGQHAQNMYKENDHHNFEGQFRFGSPLDGDIYKFDLCEECLLKFFKSFKIQPDITNALF